MLVTMIVVVLVAPVVVVMRVGMLVIVKSWLEATWTMSMDEE